MTVKVTKPAINVREELADLRKPTGIAGEAMLRAETPQEQFNLIGAGRRRINHNGAMQVSQRGTTFNSLADNTYTVDRYKWEISVIDQLVVNVTQVSDGPTGLANSLKLTVATPETAIEDNEFVSMVHVIEAQDMIQFGWGSDNPEPMSISFWVKSSIAGTYSISLYTQDGGRSIGRTYTINSANTWEYKTFFIPPDSVGFNDDNGGGVWFYINLAAGPNRTSADNTSWGGYTGGKLCYGQEVQLAETSGATWQITGFQVEKGSAATPFEHRSYGEELALCQRYYYQAGGETTSQFLVTGQAYSTTQFNGCVIPFPVTMRDAPEMSYASASNFKVQNSSGSGISVTSLSISTGEESARSASVRGVVGSGLVAGNATMLYTANTSGILKFDAEL
jgi:hypothetical protein